MTFPRTHLRRSSENTQPRLFVRSQLLKAHNIFCYLILWRRTYTNLRDSAKIDRVALAIWHQSSLSSLARKRCAIKRKLHCHEVSDHKAHIYRSDTPAQPRVDFSKSAILL